MPVLQKLDVANGTVWIGRDTRTSEEKGAHRRTAEKDFIRLMLAGILDEPSVVIEHKPSGEPYLPVFPGLFISISHSGGWYAVYISSSQRVGVDIQVLRESILKGTDYFLNDLERSNAHWIKDLDILHRLWGAKEALYKLLGGAEQEPEKAFTASTVETKDPGMLAIEHEGKEYLLTAAKYEEYYLVYTI